MSSGTTVHEFPSPVGGVPLSNDFAPSVLFTVLYALLVPIVIWRQANPRTRQFLLIGTSVLCLERTIGYALRAAAARNTSMRDDRTLETYFQATLGGGFISISQDLAALVRALLVSGTRPNSPPDAPKNEVELAARDGDSLAPVVLKDDATEDHPKTRAYVRSWMTVTVLVFLASVIFGIIAGAVYKKAITSDSQASLVQAMRYASAGIALFLLVCVASGTVWVSRMLPRVSKTPVMLTVLVAVLMSIVSTYRLVVMHNSTTSLDSTAPGSLNSDGAKAAFYVLHAAPEWVAAAILVSLDVRQVFSTGRWPERGVGRQ